MCGFSGGHFTSCDRVDGSSRAAKRILFSNTPEEKTMSNLTLPSADGASAVEYRALDRFPEAHLITIQHRTLKPGGDKYRAGEWRTMRAGDVCREVLLNGPVAQWLRAETRVDLRLGRLAAYADEEPAHLHCRIPILETKHSNVA
jgi:hypothetical protein